MSGETDIRKLLASMSPELQPEVFVFATLPPGAPCPGGIDPVLTFRERQGTTLVLTEKEARAAGPTGLTGLATAFPCRMITLNIHSSLDAVGFLAVITARLARAGMGVNPVSAFYHDHLFVPADRADEALALLRGLAAED